MVLRFSWKHLLGSFLGEWSLPLQVKEQLASINEVKDEVEPIRRLKGVVQRDKKRMFHIVDQHLTLAVDVFWLVFC